MSVMTSEPGQQWAGPKDCCIELSNLRLEASVRHTLSSPAVAGHSSSAHFVFPNLVFKIEVEFTSYKINYF